MPATAVQGHRRAMCLNAGTAASVSAVQAAMALPLVPLRALRPMRAPRTVAGLELGADVP